VGRAPVLAFDARSQEEARVFVAAGRPYAEWCRKPFVALHMYVELITAFGWDTLRRVLRGYEGDQPGGLDSDGKKMGEWAVRYSLAAGRNLVGFFAVRWNLPFDKAAAEVSCDAIVHCFLALFHHSLLVRWLWLPTVSPV
jgi:hypothetical protein